MKQDLPSWVGDERASLHREVEPYRRLSPEARGALLWAACRSAARILASRSDRAAALAYRDPLPPSSVRALERLRREHRDRVVPP